MVFLWPGSLLALVAVGAVAAWAMLRPSRELAVVGSLRLWQKALEALERSARRSTRRINASWLLLLAGATAAVLGLARPVFHARGRARSVAIAVYPSAELGAAGAAELDRVVGSLLDRLAAGDRVQLIRPVTLGGASRFLSPAEARREVRRLPVLPVAAERLSLPPADAAAQHTYVFAPPLAGIAAGAHISVIELAADLPAATFEAVAARPLAKATVQWFAALRNHRDQPWRGTLRIEMLPAAGGSGAWQEAHRSSLEIAPRARAEVLRELPAAAAFAASIAPADASPPAVAYLARVEAEKRTVALVGADEPAIRRFIQADETLQPLAEAADADLVIANRTRPPAGKPALVIDPPSDPPGWRRGQELRALVLSGADVAGDDPVMRGVDLASAAVRQLRPWVPTAATLQKVLAAHEGAALILRDEPAGLASGQPPRVYVAFELSDDNTDLTIREAFVVFLANAVRWLAPPGRVEPTYEHLPPQQAPASAGWRRLAGTAPADGRTPLLWPGVFRDEAGLLRAVSLVGLSPGQPSQPPAEAAAAAALPAPKAVGRQMELWPLLAAAAVAMWIAGWALRVR